MSVIHIAALCYVAGAAISVAFGASAIPKGQWDAGMDDDAGKAAATSQGNLPGADYEGACKIYPKNSNSELELRPRTVGRVGGIVPECFLLRIGRKPGMCQSIQTMGGPKPYAHSDYLVKPEVVFIGNRGNVKWAAAGRNKGNGEWGTGNV